MYKRYKKMVARRMTKKRMRGHGILSDLVGLVGLGMRRKPKRRVAAKRRSTRMQGRGFFDKLKNIAKGTYEFVKDNKLLSKGLDKAGFSRAAGLAGKLGLGRKRRVKRMRGGYSIAVVPNSQLVGRGVHGLSL